MSRKLIILIITLLITLSACSRVEEQPTAPEEHKPITQFTPQNESGDFIGVWISYIEIRDNCASKAEFSSRMEEMFTSFSRVGITDIFFHVRPFGDALYPSELFPTSSTVCEKQGDELTFDPLETVLGISSRYGMRLHGWINPYRASADADLSRLSDDNMAKIWYLEGKGDVNLIGDRYYFNPASDKARELIIEGAAELLIKYPDLAGIHIDDYFYPENCGDFDEVDYNEYRDGGGTLSRDEWRRENVSLLVRGLYERVKAFGEDKLFTISPNGKTDTCINKLYADVELWATEDGYCDILLPQIYFGFENESQPFEKCLESWVSLRTNPSVRLVPALALYKCGAEDVYAGEEGKYEWINNSDVIKRQVECIREKGLDGFSLYSGSYVNFSENFYKKELDNLKTVL